MKFIRLLIIALVLAAAIITGVIITQRQMDKEPVSGFQSCVDAGNPVQQRYPEVCRTPDGQSFTRPDAYTQ